MGDAIKTALQRPEPGFARKVPVQKRSREKYERILECAEALIVSRGDSFTMSDIVDETGIGFGSLYQYFPDKTAVIGTLAERYNAIGHACVEAELAGLVTAADLKPVLVRLVDGYYQMFLEYPVMRDIWYASQGDRALQAIDVADTAYLSGLLAAGLRPLLAPQLRHEAEMIAGLLMGMIAAAVRAAIDREPAEAERMLSLFKAMLPTELSFAG